MLGQSFGGFCTTTYLSLAPEGLREAFLTGGLPGLDATADDVYRVTYPIVAERNRRHYERFPMDADRARAVARHLASHEVIMPGGGRLTVPAFQSLGRMLGAASGSDTLHYLLEDAFAGGRHLRRVPGPRRRRAVVRRGAAVRAWSTRRATRRGPRPAGPRTGSWPSSREFDPAAAVDGDIPLLFTGEMIYPWMFETDPVLRPLRDAAEELAARDSLAAALRPGPARGQRRARRGGGLLRRHVRAAAALAAHRPARSAACGPG